MALNGAISPETEQALLVWVNSFPLDRHIETLDQMNSGRALLQMLHDIDSDTFPAALPNEDQSEDAYGRNLRFIHDKIRSFLEEREKSFDGLSREDVEEMAGKNSNGQIAKFLKLVLKVMLESPCMTEQVQKIMTLPPITQEVVGGLMQEVADFESDFEPVSDGEEDTEHEASRNALPPLNATMDQVVHLEQQYAKVMSQLERRTQEFKDLELELEKLGKSLARSQETNEALNSEIAERDELLKKARSVNNDREHSSIKDLETKISQQEEMISSKENQTTQLQAHIKELQRENKKFATTRDEASQLQDEIDVMKMDLEKQTRKANTADKYMQKLQASQGIEKERDSLRQELEDSRTQLSGMAKLRQENAALQQSNDESSRILSQIEQEHDELRMTKKQLRVNYDSLARQIDALNERFAQDQETIADLRDKHGTSDRISLSTTAMNGGLEGELNEISKQENQIKLRVAELEKQKQHLEEEVQEKDAKKTTLQRQLNIAMEKSADHSGQVKSLREEILSLETSLSEVRAGHPIEGTETFKRMRDQVKVERQKMSELEKKIGTSLKDVGEEGGEKQASNDQEKTLASLDMKALTDLIQQASVGSAAGDLSDTIANKLDNMLGGKIEVGRAKLAKQQETIETQEATIKDLDDRLRKQQSLAKDAKLKADQLSSQPAAQETSAQDRFYIQNLERELKLMGSAYHDLAGRLQMNNVVLQRRAEAPRSWLGRQRRAIEGPIGLSR